MFGVSSPLSSWTQQTGGLVPTPREGGALARVGVGGVWPWVWCDAVAHGWVEWPESGAGPPLAGLTGINDLQFRLRCQALLLRTPRLTASLAKLNKN